LKKILTTLVLSFLLSGNVYAAPILFNCKDEGSLLEGSYVHHYFSFDIDQKELLWVGNALVKKNDNIKNGKKLNKEITTIPFLKRDTIYIYFGWNEIEQNKMPIVVYDKYKINIEKMKVDGKYKKNWDLIRDDNTWMGEKAITNYSCNIIDRFPL